MTGSWFQHRQFRRNFGGGPTVGRVAGGKKSVVQNLTLVTHTTCPVTGLEILVQQYPLVWRVSKTVQTRQPSKLCC